MDIRKPNRKPDTALLSHAASIIKDAHAAN